ncbi:MAG: flavodoxin [Eubacteriales bacterium]|nr:flavodoxin [Eubacteriales bacterium]
MKNGGFIKRILDPVMVVLLPFLMAQILTGQQAHEWLGAAMAACFILHNALNAGWYKNLFKGSYSMVRCLMTVLNLLLIADIVAIMASGIMMSDYVFSWLGISGHMILARRLHIFAAWWGFILMSGHLGLHWQMAMNGFRKMFKIKEKNKARTVILRLACAAVAAYGIYAFVANHVSEYIFMRTHFMFFDESKPAVLMIAEMTAMIVLFAAAFYYLSKIAAGIKTEKKGTWKALAFLIPIAAIILAVVFFNMPRSSAPHAWGQSDSGWQAEDSSQTESQNSEKFDTQATADMQADETDVQDGFILIEGGTFLMGSPEDEPWRSDDETQHTVTVSSFYISPYELTQSEYEDITGSNPSTFSGENLPVENISWLQAIAFCNAKSEQEGLTPVYTIGDEYNVSWDRNANGYRLPTEAEWEYACRAGTTTPFNMDPSPGADRCNFYGHYPYQIEENYFSQGNLTVKPGEYRQTTVAVDSFEPNAWGLYNMHGNVSEWVWDYYGTYDEATSSNPTGADTGSMRVYRGGGWNDFAKNIRSAYRAALDKDKGMFNIGIRLVRNAVAGTGIVSGKDAEKEVSGNGRILIAYFSWSGNTENAAYEIQRQTGADIFHIEPVTMYSSDYNTVLEQAQHDQNIQARPELNGHVDNFEDYDIILLGYPNWWASIPMPIASFLEEYDFAGKTIIPFCSHGGGRFGQSLAAIAKLAPEAQMGEGLSIHYSGGSTLKEDITSWLSTNGVEAE